jgi:hypothetical protein
MRIIKLHIGLYRYLKEELKKKRNIKELIKFFKLLFLSYIKELFRLYKSMFLIFDANYRQQKNKFIKLQQAKKEIAGLIKLLRYSKSKLKKQGLSRQRIKRFFIDLGSSDDDALQKLCDELIKEIGE